jgi:hypothetical protein
LSTEDAENATNHQLRRDKKGVASVSKRRLTLNRMAAGKKSFKRRLIHAGGWQAAKRIAKMVPFGGAAVAMVLVGDDIRRKGVVRGALNSGLDAIPFFGLAKNAVEFVAGDFIPDKTDRQSERSR